MVPASRDIWQGHPSTQAWKIDQQQPESITELHHAAWTGDIGALEVLLGQGINTGTPDKAGHTPLHYAAAGELHTKQLVHGADASDTNDCDQTPLYCAVEQQHTAAAHLLCSASRAIVDKADEWGLTPLHIASRSGNVNIVTALLLCQADPLQQSWDKRTALHFAAQHRHPAVIRQVLLHPSLRLPDPQAPVPNPSYQNGRNHQQVNGICSDQPHAAAPDEDMQEQHPQAELNQASLHDAASSLQSLHSGIQFEPYAAGDFTNARQEEEVDACSAGSAHEQLDYTGADAEAMDALLALTSDFSVQSPPRPQNPPDHFKWQKHLLSLKDHQGNTALHLTVMEGMAEPVQVLLQAGADINTPGLLSFIPVLL
ncbi:TPA: Ankyrin repeat and death domain-containing protein 1B [Trebouxia sp. C0004]